MRPLSPVTRTRVLEQDLGSSVGSWVLYYWSLSPVHETPNLDWNAEIFRNTESRFSQPLYQSNIQSTIVAVQWLTGTMVD